MILTAIVAFWLGVIFGILTAEGGDDANYLLLPVTMTLVSILYYAFVGYWPQ